MEKYKTIEFEIRGNIAFIYLNRPDVHNAFNEEMISELTDCFKKIDEDTSIRAVVMRGKGKSFCAGADLNWMRGVIKYTYEENLAEGMRLARCFHKIYTCKKPTICVAHGHVLGGANGIIAACDFAYSTDDAIFSLSEVKIGIIPACISPYVVKRIGEYRARDLMLTGRRINGQEAQLYGLINKSVRASELDNEVNSLIELLKTSGPEAIHQCKKLLHDISNVLTLEQAVDYTAKMIAQIRISPEAQEGMAAFLEKRKPKWVM